MSAPKAIKPATAIAGSLLNVEIKRLICIFVTSRRRKKKLQTMAARRDGYDLQIK
jgi:hypothetical protein